MTPISGDGRSIAVGDRVFFQAGGHNQHGTQRVSTGTVVKCTPTRVRIERGNGKTGAWRHGDQVWFTKEAARIGFNWQRVDQ